MVVADRSRLILLLVFGLALTMSASPSTASPSSAAAVVVGVTGVDDDHTVVSAISIDDEGASVIGDVGHRRGFAPTGVVVDDGAVALVLAQDDRAQGLLVSLDLKTGQERDLLDEVMIEQRPQLRHTPGGPHLTVVRGRGHSAAGGSFDVVDVDVGARQVQILAGGERLWVTPVASADVAVMVVDGGAGHRGEGDVDGAFHIDVVDDGVFKVKVDLGVGAFRSPVRLGRRWLVERSDAPGKRASLVDDSGKVWLRGAPGLSPVLSSSSSPSSSSPTAMATSSGKKSGGVVVWGADGTSESLSSGRAGIARPLALWLSADGPVVVAWLDRGASLPGELWAIGTTKSRRLLEPKPHTAVSVYGVVGVAPLSRAVTP